VSLPPVLSALAYELGRPRRLEDLDELAGQPGLLAALQAERAGMGYYLEADEPLLALVQRAAERTLEKAGVAPAEVDAVVFATDSFLNTPEQYAELGRLLAGLGLVNAYPLNVTLSDCANLQIALRVAAALLRAGEVRRALVLSADLARHAAPSRLLFDGIAVGSDAAATALLTLGGDGLAVEAAAQKTEAALLDPAGSEHARLSSRVQAHRALFGALLAGRAEAGAVRQVFPNNFAKNVTRLFLEDNGFREEQIYLRNVRRLGHCFGSDCLINLLDWLAVTPVEEGERFVLLGSGQSQLGAVLLAATAPLEPEQP
jgi:3-oxoacyl-[acyl-carrier-protein] synthase-3